MIQPVLHCICCVLIALEPINLKTRVISLTSKLVIVINVRVLALQKEKCYSLMHVCAFDGERYIYIGICRGCEG